MLDHETICFEIDRGKKSACRLESFSGDAERFGLAAGNQVEGLNEIFRHPLRASRLGIDAHPERLGSGERAIRSSFGKQITANQLALPDPFDPGVQVEAFTGIGGCEVIDGMAAHDPDGAALPVTVERPPFGCGVRRGDLLHPAKIFDIADMPVSVDRRVGHLKGMGEHASQQQPPSPVWRTVGFLREGKLLFPVTAFLRFYSSSRTFGGSLTGSPDRLTLLVA